MASELGLQLEIQTAFTLQAARWKDCDDTTVLRENPVATSQNFRALFTHSLFLQASGNSDVTETDPIDSGVTVWDSALVMAYFLCKNPGEIRGDCAQPFPNRAGM